MDHNDDVSRSSIGLIVSCTGLVTILCARSIHIQWCYYCIYCTPHVTNAWEKDTQTLTEEEGASGQGPADLHVVNLHVLAGNVLHWNLLCNLLA